MIFKSWTTPVKADVWAKYASYSSILLFLALSGNIISGYTEFKAADSLLQGIGIVFLLEGGAWIASSMFFTNLFSLIQSGFKDVASWIYSVIGLVLLISIGIISFNMSDIGKDKAVNEQTPEPVAVIVDETKANNLKNKALTQFQADSLSIVATTMQEKESERTFLNNSIAKQQKKKTIIMSYADYTYDKYKTSISNIERGIKECKKSLRELNGKYNNLLNNRLDVKRADKMRDFSAAATVMAATIQETDSTNTAIQTAFLINLNRKKKILKFVIFLGICFTVLYTFTYNLSRFLSGSYPVYKNPFENVMHPIERILYGLRLWVRLGMDRVADWLTPSNTIDVINKGFAFSVKDGESLVIEKSSPTLATAKVAKKAIEEPTASQQSENWTNTVQFVSASPVSVENTENTVLQGVTPKITATILLPDVTNPNLTAPKAESSTIQSVNNTLSTAESEAKPMQRTVIQGFKMDEKPEKAEFEGMETVKDTAESIEQVEKMLKVFNYNKYYTQLMSTFNRMCLTKTGEKKETKNYEEVALQRLEKVKALAQLFVKQGYKVTHKVDKTGNYQLEVDRVETPTLLDVPQDQRTVKIYYAPNRFNLPIFFQYD